MHTLLVDANGISRSKLPGRSELNELLTYHPETGDLYWRWRSEDRFEKEMFAKRWNTRYANQRAFITVHPQGYLTGAINGRRYLAHRVIWKMVHDEEPDVIDHINHIKDDNRLANLRNVSFAENCRNLPKVSGVRQLPSGRFQARVSKRHIGVFDTEIQAIQARSDALKDAGYHSNHGEVK
jgi:hypothetical protein